MAEKLYNQVMAPGPESWRQVELRDAASEIVGDDLQPPFQMNNPERTIIGLPANCFSSVPVTILTAPDDKVIDQVVMLQLEKLGLQIAARESILSEKVYEDDSKQVYHALVLDDTIAEDLCVENAARFEPAVHLLDLGRNALTLVMELGQIVAAIDIDGKLAHFETLGAGPDSDDLASEIALLLLSISESLPLSQLKSIQIAFNVADPQLQQIANATGLAVKTVDPPQLREPEQSWNFLPQQVVAMRQQTKRKRQIRQLITGVAAVLILTVAGLAAHLTVLQVKVSQLESDLAVHAAEVESARQTAGLWRRMELAVSPDSFPIERLYQATRLLPEEGVRMTVFEQRGGDVVIAGEASSTPAAIKFSNDLKRSPEWGGFNWEIPPPKILPNNSAQFRITARRMDQLGEVEATP